MYFPGCGADKGRWERNCSASAAELWLLLLQCCRDARGCNSIEHPQYPNPSWKMVLRHLSSSGIAVHVSRY